MFRVSCIKPAAAAIGAALLLSWTGGVRGDVVVENFNNYGQTSGSLAGQGQAGGGWSGAWATDKVDYLAGTSGQLSYTAQGYSNTGNQTDANDGGAGYQSGKNIGSKSQRALATPMTGVVWISALVKGTNSLLWLGGDDTNNYVGIRNGQIAYRYNDNATSLYGDHVDTSATHLILVKITTDIDASGNDRITYWLDPDLSGGEGGLGTPNYTNAAADALDGSGLTAIQLSFNEVGDVIDAIRISNNANGFQEVTAAPEPGSAALIGGAACALVLIPRGRGGLRSNDAG